MFEVTFACYCHAHSVLLTVVDGILVVDGAARMCHGYDACLVGNLHAVGEREESVGSHHCAVEVEAEVAGFLDGLFKGVHTRSLARATCQQLTAFGKDDGVGFGVFHQYGGENQVLGSLFADGR